MALEQLCTFRAPGALEVRGGPARSRPPGGACEPLALPPVLHCKWSLAIVAALVSGPSRSLALSRRVGRIRHKVLFERLRELEAAGLVLRRERGGYPRAVYYRLAPPARPLRPLLRRWARAGFDWELLEMALKCKWTCPILATLRQAPLRPSELKQRLPGLGKRRTFERLAWLEARGAVERSVLPTRPPATVYQLTKLGQKLARTVDGWVTGSSAGDGRPCRCWLRPPRSAPIVP
jgi:DNA-binding HxlR family transcriptional regulator